MIPSRGFPYRLVRLPVALIVVLWAAATFTSIRPACTIQGGFPVYQCGDRAWFRSPPEGSGAVTALFWQIGYGNASINNAEGTQGTGLGPPGVFSGNDSGLYEVPLIAAAPLVDPEGRAGVEQDALCLGPVNWGNHGVDGCCDNRRMEGPRAGQDRYLNANFDAELMDREGRFAPDLEGMTDHPMAVLLREETGRWFAVAAVAPFERPSDRPDIRSGHYTFASIADGETNPLTGARNIIPWQAAPSLTLEEDPSPRAGGDSGVTDSGEKRSGTRRFDARWDPVILHSDHSRRSSEAGKAKSSGGVGALEMGPLVSYSIERVRLLPEMVSAGGIPMREILLWERVLTTGEPSGSLDLAEDSCARAVVNLGRSPSSPGIGFIPCALGRCGDVGYSIPGPPVCVEGPILARARSRG